MVVGYYERVYELLAIMKGGCNSKKSRKTYMKTNSIHSNRIYLLVVRFFPLNQVSGIKADSLISNCHEDERKELFDNINYTINNINREENVFLMGVFNTKLGMDRGGIVVHLSPFGYKTNKINETIRYIARIMHPIQSIHNKHIPGHEISGKHMK